MKSKYQEKLKQLSGAYTDLLNLHTWLFSYFLMLKSQRKDDLYHVASDIVDKYHTYKSLPEYKKILEECME